MNEDLPPIYSKDPREWADLLYKKVKVHGIKNQEYNGWVYTIDPVTETIILISFEDDAGVGKKEIYVIMGYGVKSIEVVDHDNITHKKLLDEIFHEKTIESLSEVTLKSRKDDVKLWFEKHRIPVKDVDGDLNVLGVLILKPPYNADSCICGNEIVLEKVRKLLAEMPTAVDSRTTTEEAS